MSITLGILTVSDRCAAAEAIDESGPALQTLVKEHYPDAQILVVDCVPDDFHAIRSMLITWCDDLRCHVVLTTGGTGFAPRDNTPEATRDVVNKLAPAITEHINRMSAQVTPNALLSRAVCGLRGQTLILNLPGSRKAALECFGFVAKVLRHAVDLVLDRKADVEKTHGIMQVALGVPASGKRKFTADCVALRSRKSPYPMLVVEDALRLIQNEVYQAPGKTEECRIEDSLGRVLSQRVVSTVAVPPFRASIKDGYAVIAADGVGVRRVVEAFTAGDSPRKFSLQRGEITRISTGAPVPDGANAVVQVEDTELIQASADNMQELLVKIQVSPAIGLDIREVGSDISANDEILKERDVVSPAHIGVMAAIGLSKVSVYARFSVGVLSCGNELQQHGESLKPGRIFDSNKLTLLSLLKQYGYKGLDCGLARDDPDEIAAKIRLALSNCDVLITTGGVSMGEYDLIKQVLIQEFGAQIRFGRVNMKPGKPTTFATCVFNGLKKLVFALPGNPVSASVTFLLFVLPALQRREHKSEFTRRTVVILDMEVNLDFRPEFMRASLLSLPNGQFLAQATGNQISSRLNSMVGADALLVLPARTPQCTRLEKGMSVDAIRLFAGW